MDSQANMSSSKRRMVESDAQRAGKVPRLGFDHGPSHYPLAHECRFSPAQPIMVENCYNFLKSGLPHRVMYFKKGEWCDFSEPVTKALIKGFKAKKSANELSINGRPFLVDFLSMVLINLRTGRQRSLAWIDESQKCFFPISFFDNEADDASELEAEIVGRSAQSTMVEKASAPQLEVEKRVIMESRASISEKRAVTENEAALAAVPPQTRMPNFLCTKIETLERESDGFVFVQKLFLSGMGTFATSQNILHVHRYAPKDAAGKMRLEMFERQIKETEEVRGSANLKYAWYGAGKQDAVSILVHGFGLAGKPTEEGALGTGIYLMPESRAFASVNLCDGDEKGLQYMILCRAVLGNIEQIQEGSKQHCPSSPSYDSGVDDLCSPKCYIVWSTHTNTYIHPEYVITFKLALDVREYLSGLKDMRFHVAGMKLVHDFFTRYPVRREMYKGPSSPWMSFTMLFSELGDNISSVAKELLYLHYDELKNKIITREELIKKIKVIVGHDLLYSTLQKLRQGPSPWYNDSTAQKLESNESAVPPPVESKESAETGAKPHVSTVVPVVSNNVAGLTMNSNASAE